MKKTKVIIPALGILLLSTAASVTGTVAWYAANSTVTANGMKIKATIDSNFLAISETSDISAGLASINLDSGTVTSPATADVLPTNWVNNSGWTWVSAIGTSATNGVKKGDYANLSISENGTAHLGQAGGKNYFVFDNLFIGLLGDSETAADFNLMCNVKFTSEKVSDLNRALTVGLEVASTLSNEFDERFVCPVDDATAGVTVEGAVALIAGENLPVNTGAEIRVYTFFNGDSEFCTSANAINLDDITIDLTFTLVPKA